LPTISLNEKSPGHIGPGLFSLVSILVGREELIGTRDLIWFVGDSGDLGLTGFSLRGLIPERSPVMGMAIANDKTAATLDGSGPIFPVTGVRLEVGAERELNLTICSDSDLIADRTGVESPC
jgi:hypothetical protein